MSRRFTFYVIKSTFPHPDGLYLMETGTDGYADAMQAKWVFGRERATHYGMPVTHPIPWSAFYGDHGVQRAVVMAQREHAASTGLKSTGVLVAVYAVTKSKCKAA